MKDEGYGGGYAYDHDTPDAFSGQMYFPEGMEREIYYEPTERGCEREFGERVLQLRALRDKLTGPAGG
jgi:putative ATPase